MSFYRFMMKKYHGTGTPEGDLAYDMERDKDHFPKNVKGKYDGWHELIRKYLVSKNACSDCLKVFEKCWNEYVAFEKSR